MENIVSQIEVFRQNSKRLQQETFKIDSVINQLNNCSDRCNLQYKESGLKSSEEDVECFKTCINKSHSLGRLISQWDDDWLLIHNI